MAKHKRRRRKSNFVAIPFNVSLALSTLADNTVLATDLVDTTEDLYVISVDGQFTIRGATSGEGPLAVGYAHGDLSVGEILENLNAEVGNPDDIIQSERARRPVRRAGSFQMLSPDEVLALGQVIRTTCKFSVGEADLAMWIFNMSGAVMTTGAVLQCIGTIYGRWQR